jgi:pyruvate dehydrogenase E2 component (dihydrolipoamide acetyltransferase)
MSSSPTESRHRSRVEVTLPELGDDTLEAIIVAWEKYPGDAVAQDETICVVSAGGMRAAIASSAAGQLVRLLAGVGTRVEPGASLAEIETDEEVETDESDDEPPLDMDQWVTDLVTADPVDEEQGAAGPVTGEADRRTSACRSASGGRPTPVPPAAEASPLTADASAQDAQPERRPFYSPAVRRLARKHGLDLSLVEGGGERGRVRKEDVVAYLAGVTQPARRNDG